MISDLTSAKWGIRSCALLVAGTCLAPFPLHALDWEQWWLNADQAGAARMQAGDHAAAARTFDDRRWRAAAWYRAGEYARAAQAWKPLDETEDHYNRGNALARSGDLGGAMSAYETVLARDPGHEDARHNLEVIRHLVRGGSPETGDGRQQERGEENQGGGSGASNDRRRSAQTDDDSASGEDGRGTESELSRERGQALGAGSGQAGRPDASRDGHPGGLQSVPERSTGTVGDAADMQRARQRASMEQWLRRVPDDPGGLLRRKFRYQYSRRDRGDDPGAESW